MVRSSAGRAAASSLPHAPIDGRWVDRPQRLSMKEIPVKHYSADRIRNIGLFSHGGAGKTSLAEAMLHVSGATTRLGKVEDGNTVTDFDVDEVKRRMSISLALAPIEYEDSKVNVVDVPGYADFLGEVQ